jgi:hypothetical protein
MLKVPILGSVWEAGLSVSGVLQIVTDQTGRTTPARAGKSEVTACRRCRRCRRLPTNAVDAATESRATGAAVLFDGMRVGEVTKLALDPHDPRRRLYGPHYQQVALSKYAKRPH